MRLARPPDSARALHNAAVNIRAFGFDTALLQTLAFIVIVFGNQRTTYTNRVRFRL